MRLTQLAVMLGILVLYLPFLLGVIYVLYCLGRASAGLDRLASAVEELVQRQGAAPPGIRSVGPAVPPITPTVTYMRPPVPAPPPPGASDE